MAQRHPPLRRRPRHIAETRMPAAVPQERLLNPTGRITATRTLNHPRFSRISMAPAPEPRGEGTHPRPNFSKRAWPTALSHALIVPLMQLSPPSPHSRLGIRPAKAAAATIIAPEAVKPDGNAKNASSNEHTTAVPLLAI